MIDQSSLFINIHIYIYICVCVCVRARVLPAIFIPAHTWRNLVLLGLLLPEAESVRRYKPVSKLDIYLLNRSINGSMDLKHYTSCQVLETMVVDSLRDQIQAPGRPASLRALATEYKGSQGLCKATVEPKGV